MRNVGEIWMSNEGYEMVVTKCDRWDDCTIQFKNTSVMIEHLQYSNIKKGAISNPFHLSVFGVGYIGIGEYKAKINGKNTKVYNRWNNILQRCYCPKYQLDNPSYIGCSVDERWHNFQNFAKWNEENYVDDFAIDKDIIFKGNKIYSPETCFFVPQKINNYFTKSEKVRRDLPIGVFKHNKKYRVWFSKERKFSKVVDTIEEAFQIYKEYTEMNIKELADEYKDQITEACYEVMYEYKVEITD